MAAREVFIDEGYRNGKLVVYFVRYKNRNKFQRHCAAQFDVTYGIENVKRWIAARPNLKLVEDGK